MRKKIAAANWKMNLDRNQIKNYFEVFVNQPVNKDITIIFCPPFPFLTDVVETVQNLNFFVGSQNVAEFENGAYTGEVSAAMLSSIGITHCIIGHSERRKYFNESDESLKNKINIALKYRLTPIFCCGETIEQRQANNHFNVVKEQLEKTIFTLNETDITSVIIAYEPVWAIGTGVNATPEQAQEMHKFIRNLISEKYDAEIANSISILYGGSCNSQNARELFACEDVDGGLIGGASLKPEEFAKITNCF